ncbi:MAG TPA: VOC family protein [Caulifigura sp.]|jgi:catechol 2,3-dioxygenase-like lactoylglutathione lyase family enzyme|nr:VOC family protein [Caulifigura sp.]
MTIAMEPIQHFGLVVTDLKRAEEFYTSVLGLPRHPRRRDCLILNETRVLRLIPSSDPAAQEPKHRSYRYIALQASDSRAVLHILPRSRPAAVETAVPSPGTPPASDQDPLDFGDGSLLVRDPDGNLVEFLELGHGRPPDGD